jgi:23S rRNA (cytidine1920-2'-O)/16S rRNA (cytidine1409-2'-O)-methyltransferase
MPQGSSVRGKDKIRLDLLLFEKGMAESREKAKAMIMAGEIEVNGVRSEKPGHSVDASADISIKKKTLPYVSRGGLKLDAALEHFKIDVRGLTLIDIGASTGGFTDCLLKRGAERIVAVDVGHGQLHWSLRKDPRVTILEKTNARFLSPDDVKTTLNGAVIDVSFISLKLVIPPLLKLLPKGSFIIALIKPQFEAGRNQVGKKGVVKDPSVHREVIEALSRFFEEKNLTVIGTIPSPILGPEGNREFLAYLKIQADFTPPMNQPF